MGDASTPLSVSDVKHVMRRTGFGAHPKDLKKLLKRLGSSPTRGALADLLLAERPLFYEFKPNTGNASEENNQLVAHNNWIHELTKNKAPLRSKLVLFFHDHFATQNSVVEKMIVMSAQIRRLHEHAFGNFKTFVGEMHRDPALMTMLDTPSNTSFTPNENYGRELLELFTLGEKDLAGNPNYTQNDVFQIARAFTGWYYVSSTLNLHGVEFNGTVHDTDTEHPERGPKIVFQSRGGFGPQGRSLKSQGEGAQEIDRVTEIVFQHRDSDGQSTVARRLTRKLLRYFCHDAYATPGPAEIAVIDEIIAQSGFATTWELVPLYRAIFTHDVFFETAALPPFGSATRKAVKWPVDYFVTMLRLTGVSLRTSHKIIIGGSYSDAHSHLALAGQSLLEPPSVFGWDWDTAWFASSMLLARYRMARDVIAARAGGFRPKKLIDTSLTDPAAIVDAVARSLGIDDQVSAADRHVYVDYLTDDGARTTIDLKDKDVLSSKLHGLYGLVMQSPAFLLH